MRFASNHAPASSPTVVFASCGSMYAPLALAIVTCSAAQFTASDLRLKPRLSVCVPSGLRYLTRHRVSPLLVLYLVTFAI